MARWTRRVGVFTVILSICAIVSNIIIGDQLLEMKAGGIDTHNLAVAAGGQVRAMNAQALATSRLRDAAAKEADGMDKLRKAGEAQALAMDRLKSAGEAQAKAAELLAAAGRSQADNTAVLAANTARQLEAIQGQAGAAKIQAEAVGRQAEATVIASKATDRLAAAGQAQSNAVLQSLETAKEANAIANRAASRADRPWVGFILPNDVVPQVGQKYVVTVTMANYGKSPAIRAIGSAHIGIYQAGSALVSIDPCSVDCRPNTIFPISGFTGSGYTYHLEIGAEKMTADEVQRLKDSKDFIVLTERVDYLDSFGAHHHSSGCNLYSFNVGFVGCPAGEEAD